MMSDTCLSFPGATLSYRRYPEGEQWILAFNSTGEKCPVPMRHAMIGLEQIQQSGEVLEMVNGFEPQGLYERIDGYFTWRVVEQTQEQVRIRFYPTARSGELDFSQRGCQGGA